MEYLTIGKVAKKSGLSHVTIRHYEKVGLMPKAQRDSNQYRIYPKTVLSRIEFIVSAKNLGFTLEEVKHLLGLNDIVGGPVLPAREHVQEKLDQVHEKIASLNHMEKSLQKLIDACDGKVQIEDCPFMQNIFNKQ